MKKLGELDEIFKHYRNNIFTPCIFCSEVHSRDGSCISCEIDETICDDTSYEGLVGELDDYMDHEFTKSEMLGKMKEIFEELKSYL